MRKALSVLIFLFVTLTVQAQKNFFRENNFYDLTVSSNGNQYLGAIAWSHLHGIGLAKKLKIGYGLRFTSGFGNRTNFITAPAKLTSTTTGLGVIFSENVPGNFDTLFLGSYQVNSFNAVIYINYAFSSKWEIEFNIDAVGISFGAAKTADYNSSKRLLSPNTNTRQVANPTRLNLLLTSDNDIGSLNSEILVKYWFKNDWAIKAGGSFIFSEYTTSNSLFLNNNRFRNKAFLPMIGLVYTPSK